MEMSEQMLRDIIRSELTAYGHRCRLPLSDAEIKDVGLHVEAVRELGHGNLMVGMHEIRDNHEWMSMLRKRGERLTGIVFYTTITLALGGIAAGIWKAVLFIAQLPNTK